MVIGEKICRIKINALTQEDWKPLLDLIPEIEKISISRKRRGRKRKSDNFIVVPLSESEIESIISRFLKIVYNIPIIISFNWVAWEEGLKIVNNADFDFDTLDIITKCKLITAIVRNDRFCNGVLTSAFHSGLILKILKSIEKDIIDKSNK